jgi:hypothetical protein
LINQVGVVSYANASGSIYVRQTQPLIMATTQGGTGLTTYTAGDLTYYASGTSFTKLGIGTAGYVLTSSGTAPQYVAQSTLSVGSATTSTTATNVTGGAAGSLVYQTGSGATTTLAVGTAGQILVVNAGATAPEWTALSTLGVSSISFGSTGLTPSTTTTGAVTVAGTLAIGSGGTGQTTASAAFNALSPITSTGDIILGNGVNSATRLGLGTAGYLLTSNGTTIQWAAPGAINVVSLPITKIQYQSFGGF